MAASVVNGAALFSFTTGMLLECKICEALVGAKEIAAHQYQEIWDGDPLPWESRDTFVTCPRCNEPMATEYAAPSGGYALEGAFGMEACTRILRFGQVLPSELYALTGAVSLRHSIRAHAGTYARKT
jgi:hypothetical protein